MEQNLITLIGSKIPLLRIWGASFMGHLELQTVRHRTSGLNNPITLSKASQLPIVIPIFHEKTLTLKDVK